MINTHHGNVTVTGSGGEILFDLEIVVRAIKSAITAEGIPAEEVEKVILKAVICGFKSKQERIDEMFSTVRETLEKMLGKEKTKTEDGGNTNDKKPE